MGTNNEFYVTDFEDKHFNELRQLWIETGIETPGRGDTLEVIKRTLNQGGKLILLRKTVNNELVGSSWITNDGRRLYLHHFAIASKYQGLGLGKFLLTKTLHFVKEKNMQIKLEVNQNNKTAINLYSQFGFKPLGDYAVYIIREIQNIKI